ncbi:MAG: hypothetical protein WBG17_04690 [Burkholderiaceae bacterium]
MKIPMRDAGIPVLTEIIAPPASPNEEFFAMPPTAEDDIVIPDMASALLDADDFDRLVDTVRTSVLAQLESQYEVLLGERIRLRLAEKLDALAADLAADIKDELLREMQDLAAGASVQYAEDAIFNKK